jgi:UDPglucose 6-dehydrogenase
MRRIGVIGIGKLGICFALNAERKGIHVVGVDISEDTVLAVNSRQLDTDEPLVQEYLSTAENLHATSELAEVMEEGIRLLFLFVATPSLPDGGYEHGQIDRVAARLESFGRRVASVHLVVGCTTMPGYCDRLAARLAPLNYTVSYCPEFIAQGSIMHDQVRPDQVLIGEDSAEAGDLIEDFYRVLCDNEPAFCRMDRMSGEIAKIATNCFLTTKISFANSIGDLAITAGADPDAILHAIGADSRIGPRYLRYGFGFGGPCFPRDNRALGKFADETGYELLISKATDEVNRRHLTFQFERMMESEDSIVFDHVSYKRGTSIVEESQQLALALMLADAGRKVVIREDATVIARLEREYPGKFLFETISVQP